jgi:predicted aconitase with swiveling domain
MDIVMALVVVEKFSLPFLEKILPTEQFVHDRNVEARGEQLKDTVSSLPGSRRNGDDFSDRYS